MSVQSVALASLTATYTDSEGEDGVEDDFQENSNTPQGAAPQNAQVGQPQARTSPKSGRSASNSPIVVSGSVGGKSSKGLPSADKTALTLMADANSDLVAGVTAAAVATVSTNAIASSKIHRLVSYFDDSVVSDEEGAPIGTIEEQPTENGRTFSSMFERTGSSIGIGVGVGLDPSIAGGIGIGAGIGVVGVTGTASISNSSIGAVTAVTATATGVGTGLGAGLGGSSVGSVGDGPPSATEGDSLLSDGEADSYGVIIPPEPPGQCPVELQEKITKLFRKMESGGLDMNKVIQQRKDFRNPSIYEKLIQFCSINELGTNYPPDRFDPFKWGKDSYYEELAIVQKTAMEKLEKARKEKTKIEIVSGTAKRPNSSAINEEEAKKRKSKWDQVATGAATAVKPTVLLSQPTLTTLTSSATGTKATVISAFGSLPKKRL